MNANVFAVGWTLAALLIAAARARSVAPRCATQR
jgi:hypothetical protein